MGGCVDVGAGVYEATIWRVERPEGLVESEFVRGRGRRSATAKDSGGLLMGIAIVATAFALPTAFFILDAGTWLRWVVIPVAVVGAIGVALYDRPVARSARREWQAFQRDYPSIVVRLRAIDAPQ